MYRSALDFRHFVDHLRRQGDLVDVHTEVDANLEIGAIAVFRQAEMQRQARMGAGRCRKTSGSASRWT